MENFINAILSIMDTINAFFVDLAGKIPGEEGFLATLKGAFIKIYEFGAFKINHLFAMLVAIVLLLIIIIIIACCAGKKKKKAKKEKKASKEEAPVISGYMPKAMAETVPMEKAEELVVEDGIMSSDTEQDAEEVDMGEDELDQAAASLMDEDTEALEEVAVDIVDDVPTPDEDESDAGFEEQVEDAAPAAIELEDELDIDMDDVPALEDVAPETALADELDVDELDIPSAEVEDTMMDDLDIDVEEITEEADVLVDDELDVDIEEAECVSVEDGVEADALEVSDELAEENADLDLGDELDIEAEEVQEASIENEDAVSEVELADELDVDVDVASEENDESANQEEIVEEANEASAVAVEEIEQSEVADEAEASAEAECKEAQEVAPVVEEAAADEADVEDAVEGEKAEPVAEEAQEVVEEVPAEPVKRKVFGVYEVVLAIDGYRFCLFANDHTLLFESAGYASAEGVLSGIDAFRAAASEDACSIVEDKFGRFRFVYNKRFQSDVFADKAACSLAAEAIKQFAPDAKRHIKAPSAEEVEAYKATRRGQRTAADINWKQIAEVEENAVKMGQFEVIKEDENGFRFVLSANGQILFTSPLYTTAGGAMGGITPFKRAVYIGNFYIDKNQFGRYRYMLRGAGTLMYAGESCDTKAQAENASQFVQRIVVSANVLPYEGVEENE